MSNMIPNMNQGSKIGVSYRTVCTDDAHDYHARCLTYALAEEELLNGEKVNASSDNYLWLFQQTKRISPNISCLKFDF